VQFASPSSELKRAKGWFAIGSLPLAANAPSACYPDFLDACPFCNIDQGRIRLENEYAMAFSYAHPVTDGHMLVVPRRHVSTIYDLEIAEQFAIWNLVAQSRDILLLQLKPDGFSIGFTEGLRSEQTVSHVHVHIIPRGYDDALSHTAGFET
jgi:diadenosine tetraphosphate (Ap4A) HIT family hydrolase